VARLKLETGLMQFLAEEPEMKAHFVGALLGYGFADSPHLRGVKDDARQMRAQALHYLAQFFTNVTQDTPAVIMLDDIHWADGPSLDAISHIVSHCPTLRLLVVCLARPRLFESFPDWGQEQAVGEAQATLLHLGPLPEQVSYELVAEILQQVEALPEAFQEQVVSVAEGNPFYLEELVEMAIDGRVIRRDERTGTWCLDRNRLDSLRVPPTLTSVLQARLDNLPLAEKLVLRQASVIGRVFWSAALEALQGTGEAPAAELAALARREIIHPHEKSTFSDTEEYAFKHGLMRDVAYEMVLKRNRRAYHGQVAEWLAGTVQASGRSGEYTGVIAEHYELAGERDSAADWYLQAGERARAQGAPSEARRLLDRALKHLPVTDRERRWRAMLARNQVLFTLGETETRIAEDKALVALAQELGDDGKLSQAYQLQGYCLGLVGRYGEELEAYQTALAAAKRAGNRQVEAEVLGQKVLCLTRLGQADQARRVGEEALARAREVGEDDVLVRNLTFVSLFYSEYGDSFRAAQLLEQQVAINRRNANRQLEAGGLTNLGNAYIQLGMNARAIEVLKRAVELALGIGHRQHSAYGLLNLGLAHLRNGELDQAHGELETSISELGALQDRFGQAVGQSYQALAREACGEHADALERFARAEATLVQIGVHGCANDARAGLARCLMALGRVEEARQQVEALWKHLSDNGPGGMEFPVLAYLTCADLFANIGDLGRSRTAVEKGYREVLDRAEKIGDPAWRNFFLEKVPEHRAIIERRRGG
jgi:tetratricopeptide (TPR) repeat protein